MTTVSIVAIRSRSLRKKNEKEVSNGDSTDSEISIIEEMLDLEDDITAFKKTRSDVQGTNG